MKLVLAALTCVNCGESLTATVPVRVLHMQIGCASCGEQAVIAEHGQAAAPIPADSDMALYWQRTTLLERYGGKWHPC